MEEVMEEVRRYMDRYLTLREQDVIYRRFTMKQQFDTIGKDLGVSTTRANQILHRAVYKLRENLRRSPVIKEARRA
jgi:DNA-directed RNA polymerase sigma subunit (sigma70/sigma32)